MKRRLSLILNSIVIILVAFNIAACSRSTQARSAEPSGFLGDYSQLQEGKSGEALLVYIDPRADIGKYKKVLIEPVKIFAPRDSTLGKMSPKDRRALGTYFFSAIRKQLSQDYVLVNRPGPDVMRVRVALTNADSSSVVLDTISNVAPPALALNALKSVTFGKGVGVGEAQMEAELSDSLTGKRLGAAVDKRVGGKTFGGKFDKWDDAKNSFDFWAERLRTRLESERTS